MRRQAPQPYFEMQFTAQLIASHLGGEVVGNPDVTVDNFAKIDDAGPGTITFLANPKYTHFVYTTKASVVLVRRDFVPEKPVDATLIKVDDPYGCLAQLLSLAAQAIQPRPTGIEQPSHIAQGVEISDDCYVGAFAYIGEGARIGKGVKIYPQAYIGQGVSIGDGSIIYPGAKIYYNCIVGKRCIIHAGAVIGADGFGFAPDAQGVYHKIEQIGIVEIGDDVEIGANTTIDRSVMGTTRIEHGVKLDNLIQIAHNCVVGHDTVMAAQAGVAGSSKVGAHCMVGGQVGIAGHITVGDGTEIGAQSGLPKSVEPKSRIMGSPAVPFGDYARTLGAIKSLPEALRRLDNLEKNKN